MQSISRFRLELEQIQYEIRWLERLEHLDRRDITGSRDRNRGMTARSSPHFDNCPTLVTRREK
jgi:hypothetical protein